MISNNEIRIFGSNILFLIEQRDWSIKHAAQMTNYDRMDLAALTIGEKNFKLETAIKLARFFNVSVFLLFSRLFKDPEYRSTFPFVETNYMNTIRVNINSTATRQADIALDSTTISKIMNGQRNNLTIKTISILADSSSLSISELLKTEQDRIIENNFKEDEK